MRVISLALAFTGLLATASAALTSRDACTSEFQCSLPTLRAHQSASPVRRDGPAPSRTERLSNAERLARGLPLKAPVRRRDAAAAPAASPMPGTTARGMLLVRAQGGGPLGFVSRDANFYLYRYTSDAANALVLEVAVPAGASSVHQADLRITAGGSHDFFGLVQGRDSSSPNIASGSANYLYFTATDQTSAGATPQGVNNLGTDVLGSSQQAESAVWSINFATHAVTAQWINTDGTSPATNTFNQNGGLYAGGDKAAFDTKYPAGSAPIVFEWVPVA